MDYALIASGGVFLFLAAMVDANDNFASKLMFKALPLAAAITPIIAGLDGLNII